MEPTNLQARKFNRVRNSKKIISILKTTENIRAGPEGLETNELPQRILKT